MYVDEGRRRHVHCEPFLPDADTAQSVETEDDLASVGAVPAGSRVRPATADQRSVVRCLYQPLLSGAETTLSCNLDKNKNLRKKMANPNISHKYGSV